MINCFEIKSTASMKKYLKNIEREYRIMRRELAYIKGKLEIVEKNKKQTTLLGENINTGYIQIYGNIYY